MRDNIINATKRVCGNDAERTLSANTSKHRSLGTMFMFESKRLYELVNEDGIELELAD